MKTILIKKEYTDSPGGRLKTQGPKSGEEFRELILEPAINELQDGEKVLVDFDGTFGFATSFLEEAFGGLARKHGSDVVLKAFAFKCNDEPELLEDVKGYIMDVKA